MGHVPDHLRKMASLCNQADAMGTAELLDCDCVAADKLPAQGVNSCDQQLMSGFMVLTGADGDVADEQKSGAASGGAGIPHLKGVFLTLIQTMGQLDSKSTLKVCFVAVNDVLLCVVFIQEPSCCLALYSPVSVVTRPRLKSLAADLYNVIVSQWGSLSSAVGDRAVSDNENPTQLTPILDHVVKILSSPPLLHRSYSPWLISQLPSCTAQTFSQHSVCLDAHLEEALIFTLRDLESSPVKIGSGGTNVLMGDIVGTACFAMDCVLVSHLSERDTENVRSHLRLSDKLTRGDCFGEDVECGGGNGESPGEGVRFDHALWRPYCCLASATSYSYLCLLRHSSIVLSVIVNVYGDSLGHKERVGNHVLQTLQTIFSRHHGLANIIALLTREFANVKCYLPKVCRTQVSCRNFDHSKENEDHSSLPEIPDMASKSWNYCHHIYDNVVVFTEGRLYDRQSISFIQSTGQALIDQLLCSPRQRFEIGTTLMLTSEDDSPNVWLIARRVNTRFQQAVIDPASVSHQSVIDPITESQRWDNDESSRCYVDSVLMKSGRCLCICLSEEMALSSIEEAFFTAAEMKF